ncbi:MAG: SOS response-associated peptidase [Thermodesulfobacteriota bacterium]
MCGRFVRFRNIEQLKPHFPVDHAVCESEPNYNAAPTQKILAIVRREGLNIVDKLHWGLVPFWAKDAKVGYKMINARLDTVATKPAFRDAFKKRRCLIPADGFYEWVGRKGQKQPVFITLPNGDPFAFAGLWETWQDKTEPGVFYQTCTIITREASSSLEKIHHRMPVVLKPEAYDAWMDHDTPGTRQLQEMLSQSSITEFSFFPVSKQVNSVGNNDPGNIEPVEANV